MTEFELKFEIPPASLKGVAVAVLAGTAKRQRLQASYFDTPDGVLAAHGIVVRVRKEGRRWVQTAKGQTADVLERLEHNLTLTAQTGVTPAVDLSRHAGTAIGHAIVRALDLKPHETLPGLMLMYQTDVQRATRLVTYKGSVAEVALDQGRVFAPGHSQPICELEIELKEGVPAHAIALARQWRADHGLWLSSISKSMKGQRLHGRETLGAAPAAVAPGKARHATGQALTRAVVQSCLGQMLPNASELASGSRDPDHVHHLRVGIRRLRTALRELGGLTDRVDPAWELPLVQVFRALGRQRDQSYLALSLQPQLLAAGGPDMNFKDADIEIPDPGASVRASAFQDVLLGLMGFVYDDTHEVQGEKGAKRGKLKKVLRLRLEKLHARVRHDGKKFLSLDEDQQHRVRKRLKRLRYLAEFAAPLFPSRRVSALTAALKPAQDALGLYNDELVALKAMHALAESDAHAWFGIGWLTARRLPNAQRCLKQLHAFARVKPFWLD